MNTLRTILAIIALALLPINQTLDADETEGPARRPVALALASNGPWLYSANRASGTLSVINVESRSVVSELTLGGQPAGIALIDDSHLLVVDDELHRLVLLVGGADSWEAAAHLDVAPYPVRICLDRRAQACYVTSLWSRTVSKIDLSEAILDENPKLQLASQVRLRFEPRELCLTRNEEALIVAGSFNGDLAWINSETMKLVAENRVSGHNIRGMTLSPDGKRLLVTLQRLNPLARSTRDDVHWGNMIANLLISQPIDELKKSKTGLLEQAEVQFLGEPGNAAGDPGPIEMRADGSLLIALSGVNELAIGDGEDHHQLERVSVGRRPTAVLTDESGVIYVANRYSDSVSVIEPEGSNRVSQVPLGDGAEKLSLADLGEQLFFDSRLSHDGWMSCHSCHTDGHSNGQLNDNLSDGTFVAPKRVLSLLGVSETGPWAWNGEVTTLTEQVRKSVRVTMQGDEPTERQVDAIVAYLNRLPSPPVRELGSRQRDEKGIAQGQKLFESLECAQCHVAPTYTSPRAYDVGLADAAGNRKFNPPSLRGVGGRRALFHDGSAHSLRDVLVNNKHQLYRTLTSEEIDSLVAFLQSI